MLRCSSSRVGSRQPSPRALFFSPAAPSWSPALSCSELSRRIVLPADDVAGKQESREPKKQTSIAHGLVPKLNRAEEAIAATTIIPTTTTVASTLIAPTKQNES